MLTTTVNIANITNINPNDYYYSSTKQEFILIKNMNSKHLLNAIKAILRNYGLTFSSTNVMEYVNKDVVLNNLYKELMSRIFASLENTNSFIL